MANIKITDLPVAAQGSTNDLFEKVDQGTGPSQQISLTQMLAPLSSVYLSKINVSGGTTSNNLSNIVFSNSNGVTFGLNASTLTASVAAGGAGSLNLSAGTTSNNLTNAVFSNSNNVSFGLAGSTVTASATVASTQGSINISAGTTSNSASNFVFSNSNGVSFGINASTLTASFLDPYLSSYENLPLINSRSISFPGASVSYAVAFSLLQPLSASFLRLVASFTTNSTSIATSAASASASAQVFSTVNAVVYSLGTGANSQSLQSVASGSAGFTQLNSISVAANGTQMSFTQAFTYQINGASSSVSTQFSSSSNSYLFPVTAWQVNFSNSQFLDVPFANSMAPGAYWLVVGNSTSSASNSAAFGAMTNAVVGYSHHVGASLFNSYAQPMGLTNQTSGGYFGAGSFSTAGGATTASLPISAISSIASNVRQWFQLLRSA